MTSNDFLETQVVVLDLASGRWRVVATIDSRASAQVGGIGFGSGSVWSPDSLALAFLTYDQSGGLPTHLIVRSDGTIREIDADDWAETFAWLPAAE